MKRGYYEWLLDFPTLKANVLSAAERESTLYNGSIEKVTESVPMRERIRDDHSEEEVTESSEDCILCSVSQEGSQKVNITSDVNPSQEEDIIEKHGTVPHDEVITSPKALLEKSDSLGLPLL